MKKRAVAAMAAVLIGVSALFSGCGFRAASELLSLPAQTERYASLQESIDLVIAGGAEYSSPVSGARKQSVQMVDIDSDGTQEAVAFFKTGEEKPLKAYIFRQEGGQWQTAAIIDGEGAAFDSVDFPRLSADGSVFIAIGWQISGGFTCAMSVYSMQELKPVEIGRLNYDEYRIYDADGDSVSEIVSVHLSSPEEQGVAELYKYNGAALESVSQATLSAGAGAVKVVKTGYLENYSPALFIMSTYESGYVTDIISGAGGSLKNIVQNPASGVSSTVVSGYYYARDINNDMITEVPVPKQLASSETLSNSAGKWVLQWYSFDARGRRDLVLNTFQSDGDGWYFDLTGMDESIVINRSDTGSGETAVTFYIQQSSGELTEFLSLYTLTGDNRYTRAVIGRRFRLMENGDKVYAARLPQNENEAELEGKKQDIISRFHLLTYDWDTGEVS